MFRLLKRLKRTHQDVDIATAAAAAAAAAAATTTAAGSAGAYNSDSSAGSETSAVTEYSNYDNFGERSHLNNSNDSSNDRQQQQHRRRSRRGGRRRKRRSSINNGQQQNQQETTETEEAKGDPQSQSQQRLSRKRDHNGKNCQSTSHDNDNDDAAAFSDVEEYHDDDDDEDHDDIDDDDDASSSSYSSCSSSSWSDYDTYEFSRLLSITEQHQQKEQQKQQHLQQQKHLSHDDHDSVLTGTTITTAVMSDVGDDVDAANDMHNGSTTAMEEETDEKHATSSSSSSFSGAGAATATGSGGNNNKKKKIHKIKTKNQKKSEMLEDLARTHFPDFFMDTEQGVPGAIKVGEDSSSESSDDEAAIERKAIKYRTKEDQDVAVFLSLAQRMSLESLLHLLQGHVQSQKEELARSYMRRYHSILNRQDTAGSSSNNNDFDHGDGEEGGESYYGDSVSCSSRFLSDGSSFCSSGEFMDDGDAAVTASPRIKSILKKETKEDLIDDSATADVSMNKPDVSFGTATVVEDRSKPPTHEHSMATEQKERRYHDHHRHAQKEQKDHAPGLSKRGKQFRWALVTDEQVRVVVHEIDSYKEFADDMWWNRDEMNQIRAHLIETVKFFRKHRPMYLQSVEIVARNAGMLLDPMAGVVVNGQDGSTASIPPELLKLQQENLKQQAAIVEEHMKSLMSADHAYVRGLETHICKFLSEHRRSTVNAVIEEQDDCRNCHDDDETTVHCLSEQSSAYSVMSSKFAAALARCDHIDALKASMSSWTPEVEPIQA